MPACATASSPTWTTALASASPSARQAPNFLLLILSLAFAPNGSAPLLRSSYRLQVGKVEASCVSSVGSPRSCFGFVMSAGLRAMRVIDPLALLPLFERVKLTLDLINFFVRAVLEIDQVVAGLLDAAQQFIELEVKCARIAVLRVLNQEH